MSFLNPWFAAAVAAIVIPLLLVLYFLKLRRRTQLVSSTLLWKRAVQDLQVNAPFQRLRKNLLLFLQLLILAAAIIALARPIVQTSVADAERVVILIDRSASMNTRESNQTRLDQAKEQAVRLVRTLNRRTTGWRSFFSLGGVSSQTQVMVIAFSDRATVVSPFTTNTSDLIELIRNIEPTDGRTDLREALALAEAYMAPLAQTADETVVSAAATDRLVLISDGRLPDLDALVLRRGTLEWLRIGSAGDNVAITTLRTQRNYERPESLEVFLTVANLGPEPVETDVSVHIDGVLRSVHPLQLAGRTAPGESQQPQVQGVAQESLPADLSTRSLSMPLVLERAAVVEARLSRADALPVDNVAYVVVTPPRRQRVLVVTDGRYPFLDNVMRGLPLQECPFVTPMQFEQGAAGPHAVDGRSTYDVVVFDKYTPEKLPAGNYLLVGTLPKLREIEAGETVEKHAFIWWNETHPVLRYVGLDYVYVAESQTVKVPPQAEVLAEGPSGPVLFRYATEGRQYLVLTFAVEQSNWVSKPSFPVFMYNAIRYLGSDAAETGGDPLRPGDSVRVPAAPGVGEVRVLCPDGRRVAVRADASGAACFGATTRVGVYRAEGSIPGHERFAVNLEDARESDIAPPAGPLKVGSDAVIREMAAIKTATPEAWRWFIGAGLVLVLFEWWVYNRRVMI